VVAPRIQASAYPVGPARSLAEDLKLRITERAGREVNLTRLGAGANAGVEIRLR